MIGVSDGSKHTEQWAEIWGGIAKDAHIVEGKANHCAHGVVRHVDLGLGRVRYPVRPNLFEDASGDKIPRKADCEMVHGTVSNMHRPGTWMSATLETYR